MKGPVGTVRNVCFISSEVEGLQGFEQKGAMKRFEFSLASLQGIIYRAAIMDARSTVGWLLQ